MAAAQPQSAAPENTRRGDDSSGDDSDEAAFSSRGCCCFVSFPCSTSRKSENWERISTSEVESPESSGRRSLFGRGVKALKKVREWSELAAGPRWKTFIRRFNRSGGGRSKAVAGRFGYDPMSYALNFDEGQNGHFEAFSSRYAAIAPAVAAT